jgi:hypothetical protein
MTTRAGLVSPDSWSEPFRHCGEESVVRARNSTAASRTRHDTPRDQGANEIEGVSQKPFDGDPYTRLTRADKAAVPYKKRMDSLQGFAGQALERG